MTDPIPGPVRPVDEPDLFGDLDDGHGQYVLDLDDEGGQGA